MHNLVKEIITWDRPAGDATLVCPFTYWSTYRSTCPTPYGGARWSTLVHLSVHWSGPPGFLLGLSPYLVVWAPGLADGLGSDPQGQHRDGAVGGGGGGAYPAILRACSMQ